MACDNWYANSRKGRARREEVLAWGVEDADENKYDDMPPYKLTGRAKGWILSFLDGWEGHRERVARLVSADSSDASRLGLLGEPLTVTLSRVHGDLNSNNVLFWLKYGHPLLIDFPFYQEGRTRATGLRAAGGRNQIRAHGAPEGQPREAAPGFRIHLLSNAALAGDGRPPP